MRAVVVATSDKVYEPDRTDARTARTRRSAASSPTAPRRPPRSSWPRPTGRSYLAPAGVAVATARAGNVIGGGDWAADRVVPDVVRALARGEPVVLRHPEASVPGSTCSTRCAGYLLLAERLLDGQAMRPAALNFGPARTAPAPSPVSSTG